MLVFSNDADSVCYAPRYYCDLENAGLRELRIPYGKPRNWIPIHKIRLRIGNAIARTVIKAHILTSNDHISNIGTKHAALHYSPDVCKSTFGETAVLSETGIQAVEEYLVKCYIYNTIYSFINNNEQLV